MIRMELIEGKYVLAIRCDLCGGRITDYKGAVIRWGPDVAKNGKGPFTIAHKCTCDRIDKHTPAASYWHQLDVMLVWTLINGGITDGDDFDAVDEVCRRLEAIG